MTWRGSTTVQDRIFACLPYLLPLLDGLKYGRYLFDQFPPLKLIFIPLAPLLQIEREIPFFGFILFLALKQIFWIFITNVLPPCLRVPLCELPKQNLKPRQRKHPLKPLKNNDSPHPPTTAQVRSVRTSKTTCG